MAILAIVTDGARGSTTNGYISSIGSVIEIPPVGVGVARYRNEVIVDLRVDTSDEPTGDFVLPPDTESRAIQSWSLVSTSTWRAILDRLSIQSLVEIETSIVPGVLTDAGQSASSYQLSSTSAARSALNQSFLATRISAQSGIRFADLSVGRWRQFSDVSIAFHDRLTVLTGANGAGKTSILNLLGPHFNWSNAFVSTPRRGTDGQMHYDSLTGPGGEPAVIESVRLRYTNGVEANLAAPGTDSPNYVAEWNDRQVVAGLFIPSHRAISGYSSVPQMPTTFSTGSTLLEQFVNEVRTRYAGGYTGKSAGQWMKESLLAAAFHGAGGASDIVDIESNNDARQVWQGFQVVLRRLLPESLRFVKLAVRPPEVLLVTERGDFSLDAVSGGISALIELGWQIFLRSKEYPAFTVAFDEPENHLHPEMQRSLLPRLLQSFPHVTFIVATHSPFIVTSVQDSHVYALDHTESGVVSHQVDLRRGVKSAEEVLRRILGVTSTLPLWADAAMRDILDRYRHSEMTPELFRELRGRLAEVGLLDEFPATAAALAEHERDA